LTRLANAAPVGEESLGYSGEYNGPSVSALRDRRIRILDSTLREGEQGAGVSFTTRQRLQVAWMLDYFGVDAIEISPVVSPSHFESCREMVRAGLSAQIVAHARALRQDIDVLLKCDAGYGAIYHSVSDIHLRYKLKVSFEEAVRRGVDAVEYAKSHGLRLRFTLEDASRTSPDRLIAYARAIEEAGADRISVPDTVGVMTPGGMYRLVRTVRESVSVPIDVHCHNDLGLSLANALAGLEAGADQVHVTVGGIGERSGITDLAQLSVALLVIYGVRLDVRTQMLRDLYDLVFGYLGFKPPPFMPLLGENAYKHKAGTHIAAVLRNPAAYEVVPPRLVGSRRKLVFGELLGKNGAAFFLRLMGLEPDEESARAFAEAMKRLQRGDLFELEMDERMERFFLESQRELSGGGERRMVTVTILHDVVRIEEKMLVESAARMGIDVKLVDTRNMVLDSHGSPGGIVDGVAFQRSVSYYRHLHVTAYLEYAGVTVVNGLQTVIVAGNKMLTTLALARSGVPTPRTLVAFSRDGALSAYESLGGKAVLKPVLGSWGRLVALLDSRAAAQAVLEDREEMGPIHQVYYLQEYVRRPPRDIRSFVVGDRVVAAIYRYQPPDDWRTNTARGGRAEPCPITKELEDISLRAAEAVGGGVLGVDAMETEEGLLVHEVNHNPEFRNSVRVTGIDIAGQMMEYVAGIAKR